MKNFKLTILFPAILLLIFPSLIASASFTNKYVLSHFSGSGSPGDTAAVNRLTRKALSFAAKPMKTDIIKAYIDSAELVCEKRNLEIPDMLHLARAEYFFLTSNFNNAFQEAMLALNLSEKSGNTIIRIKTLSFLGKYCLRTGSFKESIDYYNNSIDIAKKNHIKGLIPAFYNYLSYVYDALRDTLKFRSVLKLEIEAATLESDSVSIMNGTYLLGSSLTSPVRDFKLADSLLRRCTVIAMIRKDTSYIALSLANTGWNYYMEKKYKAAIEYYSKSLSYSVPGKRFAYSANAFGNLGTIYRDMGEIEKSIRYYIKSIAQAKIDNDVIDLSWVYSDMSEMYLRQRDTSRAYESYVLFKKYNDILMTKSNSKGLSDARIRYDAETHKKELDLLSLRIKNQKLLIYGYTGLFILCIAIGILLFSRAKINAKRRISEMNRKISEVTQANLRQQMNPHFIFNTLNSIQYYMYQHDKLATNNYLTKFSSLMRKVLENSQNTSVALRDELDALKLYLDLEGIRFKDKFEYKISIDEEIDTILYRVPTMLIQPYVENSICHGLIPSEGKGLIKVDLKLENDYISCIIEDNGIGREAAQEKKRNSANNHNSLGTQIVSSRLDLVNALYGTSLKTIYTDLKNENGEPRGTRVEIHIPIIT